MTTKEVNKGLIGKKVEIMVTGLMVKGTITGIVEDKHVKGIAVEHEPVHWGDQVLTNTHSTARKFDEFGSLGHAKLIDEPKNLKESLTKQLDIYLDEREELLRTITLYGEDKANKFHLDLVNEKIVEVGKIINKL